MIKRIVGIILVAFFGLMAFMAHATIDDNAGRISTMVFSIIIALLGANLIWKSTPKQKAKKLDKKNQEAKHQDKLSRTVSGEHMAGLPLGEGSASTLEFGDTGVVINGGGNEFTLSYDKITAAEVKTDVEIQKAYVSSVGGAVGGAVLFGPLGAMIGGRAKEKKTTNTEYYFIITYIKDGDVDYLSFKIPEASHADKILRRFSGSFTGKAKFEL